MPDGLRSPARRRCVTILAGAAAGAALGGPSLRADAGIEWRGTALGADARLVFEGTSQARARDAVALVLEEIERLEEIFSLYRRSSAVNDLNRLGRLDDAPLELLELTRRSLWFSAATGGAFDITVQPLWDLYARHFRTPGADPSGPSTEAVAAARDRIGSGRVDISGSGIRLKPGTRITFNGIAQGYITDRVADLLVGLGWGNLLVCLGETRAPGTRPTGRPWRIALPDGHMLDLANSAIATSSPDGLRFFPRGPHHLFNPLTGCPAASPPSITVTAPRATDADMLSTALSVLDRSHWPTTLERIPHARIV